MKKALLNSNRIDFAHLQRFVLDLLNAPDTAQSLTAEVKHILASLMNTKTLISSKNSCC